MSDPPISSSPPPDPPDPISIYVPVTLASVAGELDPPPPARSSVPASIPSAVAPSFAERFKASLRNLRKISSPTVHEDGVPVVQAPASVLLQSANQWKGYIVAQFHGLIPPPSKIYSDLNPAWGKFGNIVIRMVSDTSCLIMIPCVSTREWVLQVGYWQAGNCAFSVYPWSPDGSFEERDLTSAPTWAVLKNVPPQMYSFDGISVIASAIGEPLHTEKSRLDPFHFGDTKVKVEIMLDSSPPETIIVRDAQGYSVRVKVAYPRLPPKCCNCGRFGHLLNRCPKPLMKKSFDKRGESEFAAGGTATANTKISLSDPPDVGAETSEKGKAASDPVPVMIDSAGPSNKTLKRERTRRRSKTRAKSYPPAQGVDRVDEVVKQDSPRELDQPWILVASKRKNSVNQARQINTEGTQQSQNKMELEGRTPFVSAKAKNKIMSKNLKVAPSTSKDVHAPKASLMYVVKKKKKKKIIESSSDQQDQLSSYYSSDSSTSRSTRGRPQGRVTNL